MMDAGLTAADGTAGTVRDTPLAGLLLAGLGLYGYTGTHAQTVAEPAEKGTLCKAKAEDAVSVYGTVWVHWSTVSKLS